MSNEWGGERSLLITHYSSLGKGGRMDFKEKFCGSQAQNVGEAVKPHFPRSVCEGHWIDSPDEHESHPGESLVTRSHDVIYRWAITRNAMPATVPGTEH